MQFILPADKLLSAHYFTIFLSWSTSVLVQYIAVNIRFLLTVFK